ncbi:ATP-binding protein [Desulfohalobiaceae bacterium Ax17]|uniref:AAA family ATPase n=1 Tax=Desulfovulcanus ferrireducens TaxID=2831190 RepID=UPI00207BCBBA|nr:ATP-binding protein [Desulfovulcanus ferrireducens]MBT8764396.1 ATP-binding protein [Desulfovulcanus ferrireducens]
MTNPFYYGGVVNKDNFCNRYEEIATLKQDFLSGMNVLIYAPRRFGKTSLVLKALEELESLKFIYLDLMLITDKKEFINNYFNEISKKIETSTDKVIKFLKGILKIRPNIKVSFDESGIPSYSLEFSKDEIENTLEEVLNLPYRYVNQKKNNIVVIFDEFQEIVNLGIEEKLRSIIQHHGNKLTYVFMGSKKSIMKQLFLDKSRPLYKSVKHFPLKGIPLNEWKDFIKENTSVRLKIFQ